MSTPAINSDDSARNVSNNIGEEAEDSRSIPFNCSMPYSEFLKLKGEATKLGITRSELIRRAMQFYYHYKESNIHEQAKQSE